MVSKINHHYPPLLPTITPCPKIFRISWGQVRLQWRWQEGHSVNSIQRGSVSWLRFPATVGGAGGFIGKPLDFPGRLLWLNMWLIFGVVMMFDNGLVFVVDGYIRVDKGQQWTNEWFIYSCRRLRVHKGQQRLVKMLTLFNYPCRLVLWKCMCD